MGCINVDICSVPAFIEAAMLRNSHLQNMSEGWMKSIGNTAVDCMEWLQSDTACRLLLCGHISLYAVNTWQQDSRRLVIVLVSQDLV
jgi:hypothetical protein